MRSLALYEATFRAALVTAMGPKAYYRGRAHVDTPNRYYHAKDLAVRVLHEAVHDEHSTYWKEITTERRNIGEFTICETVLDDFYGRIIN